MNTISKSIAPNMTSNVNTPHTPAETIREETMPSWARALLESMQAINIKLDQQDIRLKNLESAKTMPSWARALLESMQAITIKFDQHDIRLKNLESPKKSNSWEASSSQIKIPKEPINAHHNSSNFVSSNDHYTRDRTDYQYNQVRVYIPMFKGGDDPKEFLNW